MTLTIRRLWRVLSKLRVPLAFAVIMAAWPLVLPLLWLVTIVIVAGVIVRAQSGKGDRQGGATGAGLATAPDNSSSVPTDRPRSLYGQLCGERIPLETLIENAMQDELRAYHLSDTPGNREILRMWNEHESSRRLRMASARDKALSALQNAGFSQPPPRSKREEEQDAREKIEAWINSSVVTDWDAANFREWLLLNGYADRGGQSSDHSSEPGPKAVDE